MVADHVRSVVPVIMCYPDIIVRLSSVHNYILLRMYKWILCIIFFPAGCVFMVGPQFLGGYSRPPVLGVGMVQSRTSVVFTLAVLCVSDCVHVAVGWWGSLCSVLSGVFQVWQCACEAGPKCCLYIW